MEVLVPGLIRVVLVDPVSESRQLLERLLAGLGSVQVVHSGARHEKAGEHIVKLAPELVVVNLDGDSRRGIELLRTVATRHPETAVLPCGEARDCTILLEAVRAGAREFLTLPSEPGELGKAVRRLTARTGASPPGTRQDGPRLVAVTGASGGVGCTSLAVNLATTLAKDADREVAIVDFDLMLGSVDACLDVGPDRTLYQVAQAIDHLDSEGLKRMLVRHESGLYVLPRPAALKEIAQIEPETLCRLLALLKTTFSTVIIDTSKSLQTFDLAVFDVADAILLVAQLEFQSLRNTARLLEFLRHSDEMSGRVRLIVNRAGSLITEIRPKKAEETLRMPITWQIPNATKVFRPAWNTGVPLVLAAAKSRAQAAIADLANALFHPATAANVLPRPGPFSPLAVGRRS